MIEESTENFILQFKPYAAPVEILPRVEGSPLLECVVGPCILHLLERTGPYEAQPGEGQVIINPTTHSLERSGDTSKKLNPVSLSRLAATGLVLERQADALIVDAGVPLVVTMFGDLPDTIAAGDWVSLESIAPVHGFFVPVAKRTQRRREADGDSI